MQVKAVAFMACVALVSELVMKQRYRHLHRQRYGYNHGNPCRVPPLSRSERRQLQRRFVKDESTLPAK